MIIFIFIIFLILWSIVAFVLINNIYSLTNNLEIIDYEYKPSIKVGDKAKLANTKNNESPDLLNKEFEVTRIKDNIVFLKSNDDIMITRSINEIEKIYNF